LTCACKPVDSRNEDKVSYPTDSWTSYTYPVDPIFQEFYEYLGGESTLGPAIAPLQESGNLKTQYVEAALMVYDPMAVEGERYQLAPLGLNFGVAEPPVPDPKQPQLRYINGHIIDPVFLPYYEKMGGARFVGRPITEARHNPEKGRIEQYFENVGFYRLEQDFTNQVFLLAYGVFACGQSCRYQPIAVSIPSQKPILPEPFASAVARLGLSFVGRTLSEPYINSEGMVEIIFENIVLVSPSQESGPKDQKASIPRVWLPIVFKEKSEISGEGFQATFSLWVPQVVMLYPKQIQDEGFHIRLQLVLPLVLGAKEPDQEKPFGETLLVSARPIVEALGILAQPPVHASSDPLMTFYPIENQLGYNIPQIFVSYLEKHGGFELSGPPITEVFLISDGKFRQCFKNLCLDYDINQPEEDRLHLAPLGRLYKERFYTPSERFDHSESMQHLRIQTWEGKTFVASNEPQEIHVGVFEGDTPLKNREPTLTLIMPDGSQQQRTFPPTDELGHTYLKIPPISAPNGTLIAYQVCLVGADREDICVGDNYLIWNYP
jgi:hypothetical protein